MLLPMYVYFFSVSEPSCASVRLICVCSTRRIPSDTCITIYIYYYVLVLRSLAIVDHENKMHARAAIRDDPRDRITYISNGYSYRWTCRVRTARINSLGAPLMRKTDATSLFGGLILILDGGRFFLDPTVRARSQLDLRHCMVYTTDWTISSVDLKKSTVIDY